MGSMWLLLLAYLLVQLGITNARLIPQDEVETLRIISSKLKYSYWNIINQTSCDRPDQSFVRIIEVGIFSNVTCNCSYSQGTICHVTDIQLKGLNLTGVIPEEFGNLTQLRQIDLSRNYVNGTIPKSLSKIPLEIFSIGGNRMSGVIPDEIGYISTLKEFVVEDNQFGGTLPKSLGNLKNLTRLVIGGNYFTGSIPETYSNLRELNDVRINGNPISGKVPDFIGNWWNLTTFDIQGTSMQGPIPSSLSILTNMQTLRMSDLNSTRMTFPNLSRLITLKNLELRNCFITGPIPDYIKKLTKLKLIDLSNNQLTGPIPDLTPLPKLKYLFLTNNSFSGHLPSWVLNGRSFDVSYNNFSGPTTASCQQLSVNVVSSFLSVDKTLNQWCLKKNLPCSNGVKYHSLFVNCGGREQKFEGRKYEEDTSPGAASYFFVSGRQNWAYSSTGLFMSREDSSYKAEDESNLNLTDIYQTARLAPLSLKYYGLCLKKGSYHIKLHFAEIRFPHGENFDPYGRRIFDVAIQGTIKLKDFNIAAEAGGFGKQIVKEFDVDVNGSTLEIHLYWAGKGTTTTVVRNKPSYGPLINAITVTPNFKVGSRLSAGAITGVVLASCLMLALILVFLRKTGYLGGRDSGNEEFRKLDTGYFTLSQIKTATDDFNLRNKIGEGGFGPVYKGILPDGKVIAVKQLSSKSKQGNREFVNEIGMISALQHPNLVKLYGCCIQGKELLLIYEYMENNCLARALFGKEEEKLKLDWETRKKICLGIARGLAYLHEESMLKIVHRDIKATNVLLDKDFNAKISDFGLAKLDEEENTHISTRIAGTIGYMAPEYATRGYLTDKADVYSFGVVVLEIVSGKSNAKYRPKQEFVYLLDWAYVLQEQGNLLELVDPSLDSNYSEEEALRLLNLVLLCTNPSHTLRPTMSSVISMIDGHIPIRTPIVKESGTKDKELRFKSMERLPQDSNTHESSSQSSQMQRSMSMDVSWAESSSYG